MFRIPTIREIDEMRVELGLSQAELSRRAGFEKDRFNGILYNGYDPHTSTLRSFLDALQDAEPKADEEIERRGPKPEPSTSVDEYERLSSKLEHMDPDDVGDDPSPPDSDGVVTDGGVDQSSSGTEQTPCEECGEPIRFDRARAYYKTPDERFWHPDCLPEEYRSVDTDTERSNGGESA
ncbi:hypothetical protein SAMN05192561_11229 [Halopenitus malekzadehii]|uniref:HTH cro/C1-type domain-containing protein n=2 Tax=Halopenitus malekzadehii TaxID=1267564 RepID=A0A1H6JNS6_9EURY|nr:hypothetical protein SAMN05192561_11229 [Halopenitus malekzadehii]